MRSKGNKDEKVGNEGGDHQSTREKERGIVAQVPSSQCQHFLPPASLLLDYVSMFRDGQGLQVWQPAVTSGK